MKEIKLTQDKITLVDDEDFDWLDQWKWCAVNTNGYWYALRSGNPQIRMHQAILNPPEGYLCDHINHDGLDNRRFNLRVCTRSQNSQNQKLQKGGSSRFKGVYWHKPRGKWLSYIQFNGEHMHLGLFTSEEEAAMAYNQAATNYFGEFAKLNEVMEVLE